jgi:hypothetical protein
VHEVIKCRTAWKSAKLVTLATGLSIREDMYAQWVANRSAMGFTSD